MKRKANVLAALLLLIPLTMSFASGNNQASAGTGQKGLLSDGSKTFSVFIGGLATRLTSYEYKDNTFTRKIVDETGINLDFLSVSSSDASTRLGVILNTGDYPELIMQGMSLNDLNYYAEEGILLPLDAYDKNPSKYPNIKAAFDDYPGLNARLRGTDGKLYALPAVNDILHGRWDNRGQYHMPWIRDNNRKVPETLEEFTAYLRFVRDNDVNGNGDKTDEIPMVFNKNELRGVIDFFAKSYMPFVNANGYFGLSRNGTRLTEQYRSNEFRQALKYLAGLYNENLLLHDSFILTDQQLRAFGVNPDYNLVAVAMSQVWGTGTDRSYDLRWLPPLAGPTGERHSPDQGPWSGLNAGMSITNKCKDPELAIAFYDYLIGFENSLDSYFGPKGVAWTEPDPGSLSFSGGTPFYKALIPYTTAPVNTTWDQSAPMIRGAKFRYGEQAVDVPNVQKWLAEGTPALRESMKTNGAYAELRNYFLATERSKWATPVESMIPMFVMNSADSARAADIDAVLKPAQDQAWTEFITGVRDINSDTAWNAYLAELDRLNSPERVRIIEKYLK